MRTCFCRSDHLRRISESGKGDAATFLLHTASLARLAPAPVYLRKSRRASVMWPSKSIIDAPQFFLFMCNITKGNFDKAKLLFVLDQPDCRRQCFSHRRARDTRANAGPVECGGLLEDQWQHLLPALHNASSACAIADKAVPSRVPAGRGERRNAHSIARKAREGARATGRRQKRAGVHTHAAV